MSRPASKLGCSSQLLGMRFFWCRGKTKSFPDNFSNVIGFDVEESSDSIDASTGTWLKNRVPTIRAFEANLATTIDQVPRQWDKRLSTIEKRTENCIARDFAGLRSALYTPLVLTGRSATAPGTVVMPTGTGKTAKRVLSDPYLAAQCRRVLVVVPTDALRTQLYFKFLTLGILKDGEAGVVSERGCIRSSAT